MDLILTLFVVGQAGQSVGWLFDIAPEQVCYGNLGCFSSERPYTNTRRLLPQSPESIGTKFYLATRNITKQHEELVLSENHEKCTWKSFCGDSRIIVIIHGYMDHVGKPWVKRMIKELLEHDNYNVIAVDWRNGADEINYVQSAANIRVVGAQVAQLLKVLQSVYDIDPSNVHIIGHSLGAHAAGYAGEHMENIGRITGLDPAGPAFENEDPRVRLDKTDAVFVDVMHTDAENLLRLGFGLAQPSGTVDFYVNGGKDQPGCPNSYIAKLNLLFNGNFAFVDNFACSHLRVLDYFTESINSRCRFTAYPCDKINVFSSRFCTTCGTSGCAVMGFRTNTTSSPGKYFLTTNSDAPFCLQ